MLEIITVPHPTLTKVSRPVKHIDNTLKKLISDMKYALENASEPEGVGLSAPQVNELLRLFVVKNPKNDSVEVFINPEIVETKDVDSTEELSPQKNDEALEGCLSIPNIWAAVKRPNTVHVTYQTIEKKKKDVWFHGFMSVVIQHEIDHLNGILFTQRALEQGNQIYKEINGELRKVAYL